MRAAKNEDVHKRINAFMAGDATLSADESAVLMEIVAGAEMTSLKSFMKLRRQIQPKLDAAKATTDVLTSIRARLFTHATRLG